MTALTMTLRKWLFDRNSIILLADIVVSFHLIIVIKCNHVHLGDLLQMLPTVFVLLICLRLIVGRLIGGLIEV